MRGWPIAAAVLAAACGKADSPPEVPPDWGSVAVDGIRPLMRPAEVARALAARGYVQEACSDDRPALAAPLAAGADSCWASPRRPLRLRLFFRPKTGGGLLDVAVWRERSLASDSERRAHNRAFAAAVQARLGVPDHARRVQFGVWTLYWFRPKGTPELPDNVRVDLGGYEGANVTLTSMWSDPATEAR